MTARLSLCRSCSKESAEADPASEAQPEELPPPMPATPKGEVEACFSTHPNGAPVGPPPQGRASVEDGTMWWRLPLGETEGG